MWGNRPQAVKGGIEHQFCPVTAVFRPLARAAKNDYKGTVRCSPAWLAVFFVLCAFGQTTAQMGDALDAATVQRIARLSREFGELQKLTAAEEAWIEACKTNCDSAGREVRERSASARDEGAKSMDRVAAEIHGAIDEYVSMAVSPKAYDPKAIQERLRRLLGAAADGGPYAFSVGSRNDRHLVIAYAVQKGTSMGPGATSVTVRAYASSEGRFAFVGVTGDDMDGYGSLNVAESRASCGF